MTQNNLFSKDNLREIGKKYWWNVYEEGTWEDRAAEEFMTFTDKASYLQWVEEWKEAWKKLSQEQKELRILLSQPHENLGYDEHEYGDCHRWTIKYPRAGYKQSKRHANKEYLRLLLKIRMMGKKKSWQMKQESKS